MIFNVANTQPNDFAAVYVVDPSGGDVFGEIRSLPARSTVPLGAMLGAGRYAFRCVFSNGTVKTSRAFRVTGSTTGAAPGLKPLPDLDLERPVTEYRAWVAAALPGLVAACRTLDGDVEHGDLAAARADWLTGHLDYERLGAAYHAFGDFADEIDGGSGTGFVAIEYGLWHGTPPSTLRPLTRGLVAAVQGLIQDFPSEDIDPGDLPLRTHEILENALQFPLTAAADQGSGSTLGTVYANTEGTEELLTVLAPLLDPRAPGLVAGARGGLRQLQADLLATRSGSGGWTPVGRLTAAQRERLDADLDGLLEQLADVPTLLAPRPSA